jgi:hypothetical protein
MIVNRRMQDVNTRSRERESLLQRFAAAFEDPQVRLSLLAAVALLVEAVVAKNVLDVRLDFLSQFAPLWIYIGFQFTGQRDRLAEIATAAAMIGVTTAILVLYAL